MFIDLVVYTNEIRNPGIFCRDGNNHIINTFMKSSLKGISLLYVTKSVECLFKITLNTVLIIIFRIRTLAIKANQISLIIEIKFVSTLKYQCILIMLGFLTVFKINFP